MKKNIVIGIILVVVLVAACVFGYFMFKDKDKEEEKKSDAVKFSEEYTQLTEDNVFVYRNADEIIKILENGTGVVLFGFPECPWCQRYVVYLNEVAKELGIDKIYYFNVLKDRADNTKEYQKIVSLIGNVLDYDDEGNKRIFVPDVTVVKKGEVVGHNNDTSMVSEGTPEEYWTDKKVTALKKKLKGFLEPIKEELCSECNVD